MNVHRDTAAIVPHRHGPIDMNGNFNFGAKSREMFVDRVIEHLEHQMVQTPLIRVSDEHAGPFADRLQAFQLVNLSGVVFLCRADSGRADTGQFINRNFIFSLQHSKASNGPTKRIPGNASKTTNNLVV